MKDNLRGLTRGVILDRLVSKLLPLYCFLKVLNAQCYLLGGHFPLRLLGLDNLVLHETLELLVLKLLKPFHLGHKALNLTL